MKCPPKCDGGFTITEYILLVIIVAIVFLALTGRIGMLTHWHTNSAHMMEPANSTERVHP